MGREARWKAARKTMHVLHARADSKDEIRPGLVSGYFSEVEHLSRRRRNTRQLTGVARVGRDHVPQAPKRACS